MKVAVWDTYIIRKDGKKMHFDILVEENQKDKDQIFEYGKTYLKTVQQDGQELSSNECTFCHIGNAPFAVEEQILDKGYAILELENCH